MKKHINVILILNRIDRLISNEIHIDFLMRDRWFLIFEFLAELKIRSIEYIKSYKKLSRIKMKIANYLNNRGEYVRKNEMKGVSLKFYYQKKT